MGIDLDFIFRFVFVKFEDYFVGVVYVEFVSFNGRENWGGFIRVRFVFVLYGCLEYYRFLLFVGG